MLELIAKIPENVGWMIVGGLGTLLALTLIALVVEVIRMVVDNFTDYEEEVDEV